MMSDSTRVIKEFFDIKNLIKSKSPWWGFWVLLGKRSFPLSVRTLMIYTTVCKGNNESLKM